VYIILFVASDEQMNTPWALMRLYTLFAAKAKDNHIVELLFVIVSFKFGFLVFSLFKFPVLTLICRFMPMHMHSATAHNSDFTN